MAWSWRDNPITNTVKAGCRVVKNTTVRYVAEPIKKHVIKPAEEIVDGVKQDPAAFVRNIETNPVRAVKKAYIEPVAENLANNHPELTEKILNNKALQGTAKVGETILEAPTTIKNATEKGLEKVADVAYEASPHIIDKILDSKPVQMSEDVSRTIDATLAKAFTKDGIADIMDHINIPKRPTNDRVLSNPENSEDMIFVVIYRPTKETPTGHIAVQQGKISVDFYPTEINQGNMIESLLKGVKRKDDTTDSSLQKAPTEEEVGIIAIKPSDLKRFYMQELGMSESEAQKAVQNLPQRMDALLKNRDKWAVLGKNCADGVSTALMLPRDQITFGNATGKNSLALPSATERYLIDRLVDKNYGNYVSITAYQDYTKRKLRAPEKKLSLKKRLETAQKTSSVPEPEKQESNVVSANKEQPIHSVATIRNKNQR